MPRNRKTDIPGVDRRVSLEEVAEKGWEALFSPELEAPLRMVVEIGFGRGEFLRQLAADAPEVAHLGIEVSRKRILKLARRLAREDVRNVRLLCEPGEKVLADALAESSVEGFWVNFPDPWPKKRHHKNRLLQAPILRQMTKRLRPGGVLQVATDHADYAEHIHEVLRADAGLENLNAPEAWLDEVPGRMHTAYEEMWREEGRALHFFSYRRRAGRMPA